MGMFVMIPYFVKCLINNCSPSQQYAYFKNLSLVFYSSVIVKLPISTFLKESIIIIKCLKIRMFVIIPDSVKCNLPNNILI